MSNQVSEKFLEVGCTFALGIFIFPVLAIYQGWVISWLWHWYVIPLGFNSISAWHGAGLCLFAGHLIRNFHHEPKEKAEDNSVRCLFYLTVSPLFTLFFGWLFHSWI